MSAPTPHPAAELPAGTPNHHAGHPGFAGVSGLVTAGTMLVGRGPTARLAADLVHLEGGDRVVDVGCGPGAAAREAARRGASVIGVEPAAVMRSVARWATGKTRPITWVDGTAEALPVAEDSATVVWSLAAVHHWADIGAGLAEARRVLRPGGRFLAIERRVEPGASGLASHGWVDAQADAFAEACSQAGFVDVATGCHQLRRGRVLSVVGSAPSGRPRGA